MEMMLAVTLDMESKIQQERLRPVTKVALQLNALIVHAEYLG